MGCRSYYLCQQCAFGPVGDPRLVRLFGESKWTDEAQAADTAQPRTRLVKDVLTVGRWKVGREADGRPVLFAFTAEYLARLAAEFAVARGRGASFNLCHGHGDARGVVNARDLIAPIDDVRFDGRTLWATFYVTPEQADYLSNPARKVSCGIAHRWEDGRGRVYGDMLVHVAVVDNPVVLGQGGFMRLSNDDEGVEADDGASTEGPTSVGAELLSLLNQFLSEHDAGPLPADLSPDDLIAALVPLVEPPDDGTESDRNQAKSDGGSVPGERVSVKLPPGGTGLSAAGRDPQTLMQLVHDQSAEIAALSHELVRLRTDVARRDFSARLTTLAESGHITAAVVKRFTALGERGGWNQALLEGLESMRLAPRGSVARRLAKRDAPEVEGVSRRLNDEEVAALSKQLVETRP